MSEDELKEKMFTWVYDSKNKNNKERRDFIHEKMKKMFPSANSLVLVRNKNTKNPWSIRSYKAFAHFEGYGDSDVIICYF